MLQKIRQYQHAQPFHSYQIELSSGRTFEIDNPDLVSFTEAGPGLVAVWDSDRPGYQHILSALHIVRVEGKAEPTVS